MQHSNYLCLVFLSHAGGFSVGEDGRFTQFGGEHEAEPAGLLHGAGGHPQTDGRHTRQ